VTKLGLSIFFPAYNEEKNFERTVSSVLEFLKGQVGKQVGKFEILIIDDGSQDRTGEIAGRLAENLPSVVRVIHHLENRGYGTALKSGFYNSKFDWVFFTDSDGQFNIRELKKFLDVREDADLVIGYRVRRADPLVRVINAKLYGFLIGVLFGLSVRDVNCAFKLIKREVIRKIPKLRSEGALINAELLIQAKRYGFKIKEVGVSHYPRLYGKQTGANLSVILKMFKELFVLWKIVHARKA